RRVPGGRRVVRRLRPADRRGRPGRPPPVRRTGCHGGGPRPGWGCRGLTGGCVTVGGRVTVGARRPVTSAGRRPGSRRAAGRGGRRRPRPGWGCRGLTGGCVTVGGRVTVGVRRPVASAGR